MADYQPKITASTVDQFNQVQEQLNLLPKSIVAQIEVAEWHPTFKMIAILNKQYTATVQVVIPSDVSQISYNDDYISIYTFSNILFKLPEWYLKQKVNYNFIQIQKPKTT